MELGSIEERERGQAKIGLRRFRFDLSVMFAVACLMILVIYLGNGVLLLLESLEGPFSRLLSSVKGISINDAETLYRDFIRNDTFLSCLDLFTYLMSLALPFLFVLGFMRERPASYFPVKAVLPKKAGRFILFSFGFTLSMNLLCNLLLSKYYPELSGSSASGLPSVVISLVMTLIIAPIGEELIFRGVIFQTLMPYGTGFAVFASSLIFALAHRNPPQMINAFFFGLCLAIGFYKTRSVTVCVLLHLVNNAFSVTSGYLLDNQNGDIYVIVIGIVALFAIGFAVVAVVEAIATRKSRILVCDDYEAPTPRISASRFARCLLSDFFFWFYLVLIALGTVVLYK